MSLNIIELKTQRSRKKVDNSDGMKQELLEQSIQEIEANQINYQK